MNHLDLDKLTVSVCEYKKHIHSIEALCKTWHEDRKYVKEFAVKYNPDRKYFDLLNGTGDLVTICILYDGILIGVYLGIVSACMQDKDKILCHNLMWCIHKDFRTSAVLMLLLKTIDTYMQETNVDIYSVSLEESKRYNSTSKYLTSEINPVRFIKLESYYYREVQHGSS